MERASPMRAPITALAALALAACAAPAVTSSNPRSVIVNAGTSLRPGLKGIGAGEAQRMAELECARHGRHAAMMDRPRPGANDYVFMCIE